MQRARVSNHPCHRLSVPSAKRFWCRHCMMVFEDAITRWRHSRNCRSGSFDNFVRRREIETQALQKMAETLDPEMITPIAVPRADGTPGNSKELCCFICKKRFLSLDEMREHVKYPCNKPATVQQRPSLPLVFSEPTFGTGIQQHYTDGPVLQSYPQQGSTSTAIVSSASGNPQTVTLYMNDAEQERQNVAAKPTSIYVNENGETVIEVENLDINTKGGELSLAHLLAQLSEQGIVFDQHGEAEVITDHQEPQVVQETVQEVDFSQPTAVDAANTLTQLAGSAFRSSSSVQETYVPSAKRFKTEAPELQYQLEQTDHTQTYTVQKEETFTENAHEKYFICTSESEMIQVVPANEVMSENTSQNIDYHNGESVAGHIQSAAGVSVAEGTIVFQSEPEQVPQTVSVPEVSSAPADNTSMIVLEGSQAQVLTTPTGEVIKAEIDESEQNVIAAAHGIPIVEPEQEQAEHTPVTAVSNYPSDGATMAVITGVDGSRVIGDPKHCLMVPIDSQLSGAMTTESAVTSLLEMGGEFVQAKNSEGALVVEGDANASLLLPQIVAVSSSTDEVQHVILQQ